MRRQNPVEIRRSNDEFRKWVWIWKGIDINISNADTIGRLWKEYTESEPIRSEEENGT